MVWSSLMLVTVLTLASLTAVSGQYSRSYERTSSSSSSSSSSSRISPPYVSSIYSRPFNPSPAGSAAASMLEPIIPYYNRHQCRNNMPMHYQMGANGIVFTGYVSEVLPDRDNDNANDQYQAQVVIKRLLAGPRSLGKGSKVTVAGFGHPNKEWCHVNVKAGQTWIFITQPIVLPDYLRLNASLLKMNLNNLERIEGIIENEPYRPLTPVNQLACERKYCENNANCVEDSTKPDGARCECLPYCKKNYAPVCASNNETYENECEVRLRSCYIGKNLFIKSLTPCFTSRGVPALPTANYGQRPSSYRSPAGQSRPEPSGNDDRYTSSYTYRYNTNTERVSNPRQPQSRPLEPQIGGYRYNYRSTSPNLESLAF